MADSAAMIGYGSTFELSTAGNSPTSYITLGEVYSITPPSANVDMVDVTHMQSANRRREFISGLVDGGECAVEMNYIPGSASDLELNEILDLAVGVSRRRQCRVTFPNAVTMTFMAELMTYEKTVPNEDKITATASFKVTGAVTQV